MTTGTAIDVVMPQMGVSVSEGTIVKWLKGEGEPVQADEALLEISTDKVDTEVPSPGSGVVQQILVQEGETVEVGTTLAVIAPEAGRVPAAEPAEQEPAETAKTAVRNAPSSADIAAPLAAGPEPEAASEPSPAEPKPPAPAAEARPPTERRDGKTFVSPVVARIAAEHGLDVAGIEGTGRGGRVTKKDILSLVEAQALTEPGEREAAAAAAPPEAMPLPAPAATPSAPPPPAGEHTESMDVMRKSIAEHMRRSLDTAAHVTSAIEVDMSRVVAIRERLKQEYQDAYGVNPTYLAFVARATVDTLRDYPWVNGEIRGDQIVTRSYVNLGIAVELKDGKGLIVPVIRNAEDMNLLGLARAVADVAARARSKQLLPDDVQGGTFTITNPGGYGVLHGTPIISQPQAAILGTYTIVKRPWVIEDELGNDVIAIRPIMNISLTYDHRLVDGALASRFLHDLRKRLETWSEERY